MARRVHANLRGQGERHSRKRIARLMREAGLVGANHRRGGPVTTRRDQEARPARDLVDRNFRDEAPSRLWVADITYVPTAAGFLYLAVVLDALEMAVTQRRPRDVICHSDQGSQDTSLAFGNRCQEAGVRPSMGVVGDAFDNAMAESFLSTLACEVLARRRLRSQAEARTAVFSYIEDF